MDQFCQHARFTATDIIQHLNQTVNPDRTRMILLGNLQRRNGRQNPSLLARLPPENIRSITNRASIPDIQGPGTREEIIAYIHSIQFPDEVHGYL